MRNFKLILTLLLVTIMANTAIAQGGATFGNSQVIGTLPFFAPQETTCGYGDNYTTQDIGCMGKYLSGEEKIYSFTPSQNLNNIEIRISNMSDNFLGLFVVDDSTSNGNCLGSVYNEYATDRVISGLSLQANHTYYIIVSSWANPACLSYDLEVLDQTCPAISDLTAQSVSDVAVTFSWMENGGATQWEYEYGGHGYTVGTGTSGTANSNSHTLSGLTPVTGYDIYVRAQCGTNGNAFWVGPLRVTTICGLATDFTEDFNLMTNGPLVGCWQGFGIGTTSSAQVTVDSYATNAHSGSKSIKMVNGSNSSGDIFFIPPPVSNLNAGTHRLKFYAKSLYSKNVEVIVGTITDPNDAQTFSPLKTFTTSNTYTEYVVNVANYSGGDYYLAIKMGYSGTYEYLHIDDLVWEAMPSCISPDLVSSTVLDTTQVEINWTEIGNAGTWDFTYGTAGFTLGQGISSLETNTSKTLTGLTPNTAYEYYVRSICGPGDSSIWEGPFGFFTNYCTPQPSSVDGDGITLVSMGALNHPSGKENGNYGDYSHLIVDQPRTSVLDVSVTLETSIKYDVYVWIDWNDDMVFSNSNEVYYLGASNYNSVSVVSGQIAIPAQAKLGNHRIRIGAAYSAFSTGGDPCYSDTWATFEDYTLNVLPIPTCLPVDSLSVSQIGITQALVSWLEVNSATQWEYEYGEVGFKLGTGTRGLTSVSSKSISQLSPATAYEVYVRSICSASDTSAWSVPEQFFTLCAPSTSFDEGFEFTSGTQLPGCWSGYVVSNFGSGAVDVTSGNANSGSRYARLSNFGDINAEMYLVSEEVSNLNAQTHRLRFSIQAANEDPVQVGWMTDPRDASTFQTIQTVIPSGSYQEILINVGATVPSQGYLAFRANHSRSYQVTRIDDVYWEEIPSCLEPLDVVTIPAQNAVTVQWTQPGNATSWYVEYGHAPLTPGNGTGIFISTNPYTITGLDSAMQYELLIQAVCGSGDSSSVQGHYAFFTDYCEATPSSVRGDGITNVTIGTINNTTGAESNQYGDYTHLVTSIAQTQTVNLSVETASGVSWGNFVVVAWIDLNNDLEFNNTDEMFYLGSTPTGVTGTVDLDISIPYGVPVGNHRMRIIAADYWYNASSADPCYNGSYASVEDYTINVLPAPSCITPIDLVITETMHDAVSLEWTSQGSATQWAVEVGPTGFPPGSGTVHLVSSNPATIGGLSAGTSYDFIVKAICAPGDSSAYSGVLSANTSCTPFSAPYTEDVELHTATSTGIIGNCWEQTGATGRAFNWNVARLSGTPSSNTGPVGAYDGLQYFYLESSNNGTQASLVSPVIDVTGLTSAKWSFMYHMFGSSTGTLLLEYFDGQQWSILDSIVGEQQKASSDAWLEKSVTVPTPSSGFVKLRFTAVKNGNLGDIAIDEIKVTDRAPVDVAVQEIVSLGEACDLGNEYITITLKNEGRDPLMVAQVFYELNGTIVTEIFNGAIAPGDTAKHTFSTPYVYSQAGEWDLKGYVQALNDADLSNDTLIVPVAKTWFISSFPYLEDFENGQAGWIIDNEAGGSFEFGTPNSATINGASSGNDAFVTHVASDYGNNEESYVYSPCFDFSSLQRPHIQMRTFWKSHTGDGAQVQYSIDGGNTWQVLGQKSEGENWYNHTDYSYGDVWTGGVYSSAPHGSEIWGTSTIHATELANQSNVRLRVVFQSNGYSTNEGFAFDDVAVFEGVSLGNDVVLCASEDVTLNPGNFTEYSWNDGTDAQVKYIDADLTPDGEYIYSVIVSGIQGYKMYDTVNVRVDKPELELGNDSVICFGANLVIVANPNFDSYTWNDGSTQPQITVDAHSPGVKQFNLTAVSTYGCAVYDEIAITVNTEVVVDLGVDTVFSDSSTQGTSYLLDAGPGFSSYLWSDQSTNQTYLVDPNNDGEITVQVTNMMGCTGSDTVNISFVLGIPDMEFTNLSMYPNPATDYLIIELDELQNTGEIELRILDISGKVQKEWVGATSGSRLQETIDVSRLNPGTYFLQIQMNGKMVSKPFIVH